MNAGRSPEQALPLTPYVAYILKILSRSEHHAYAIFKQLRKELKELEGNSVIGTTTLYRLIERMVQDQLIVASDNRPDPALDDDRRTYFRITTYGEEVLKAEVARIRKFADDCEAIYNDRTQADLGGVTTEPDSSAASSSEAEPEGNLHDRSIVQKGNNPGAMHLRQGGRHPSSEAA